MFVGAAVAGVVISTAGGVKARGALLRDVSCYLIGVAAVAIILSSGSFTWPLAVLLLVMYLLFVAAVLAADIIHIWQSRKRYILHHLPRRSNDAVSYHGIEAQLLTDSQPQFRWQMSLAYFASH